ncbi:hypothetical protein VM1G_03842 [Cytospora mali]|uniref:RING-type domain-containing protein n=1 Tax=Cytospora mali TaxID=578113 RepID=A0A194VWI3_CYTMA|nr:hypothetical protein VM1G_03842 [Valsa mali]
MLSIQRSPAPPSPPAAQQQDSVDPSERVESHCRASVLTALPDIDPECLTLLCEEAQWDPNLVIDRILDQVENGYPYPTVPKPNLKRKRNDDEETQGPETAAKKFDNDERRSQRKTASYIATTDTLLQQSFPHVYVTDIRKVLARHGNCLYPAFLALDKALDGWDDQNPPFKKKTRITQSYRKYDLTNLDDIIRDSIDEGEREALEEFRAVSVVQSNQRAEAVAEMQRDQDEKENFENARLEGNIADCGCCFVEFALNRMVHCDGDTLHWFCRDCARMMAETQIGLSKYHLECMSTDGCTGHFALDQREIFLDANARTALDRIEQEAVLREAGIENLETCPQCPFAAEYPPIEVNKEFNCLNPECGVVSCRSCRKETHVPKSCAEAALDSGHSARHEIEEAMSAALIRKCNRCSAPFIKQDGCNKMTCTKCRNIQCYVCSKSCDYAHFNDPNRGGKSGNCPLFDNNGIEVRHQEEVRMAEEEARKTALEKHPEVQAEFLDFKVSDNVKKDEDARKGHIIQHARRPVIQLPHVHFPGPRAQQPGQPEPAGGPPALGRRHRRALAVPQPFPARDLPRHLAVPQDDVPLGAQVAVLRNPPAQAIQPPIQHLGQPVMAINPQAMYLQPPAVAAQPNMALFGMLPMQPPAPAHMMSHALTQIGDLDRIYDGRSEPPLASPTGNGQLGVANLHDYSVLLPPQEEPAVDPVPLWPYPPRDLEQHGDHGGGFNELDYNDFVEAIDEFNRDEFMEILNGLSREEAQGLGGARGGGWNF